MMMNKRKVMRKNLKVDIEILFKESLVISTRQSIYFDY